MIAISLDEPLGVRHVCTNIQSTKICMATNFIGSEQTDPIKKIQMCCICTNRNTQVRVNFMKIWNHYKCDWFVLAFLKQVLCLHVYVFTDSSTETS